MATDLQPGFQNNINIIHIRTSGSSSQNVTDRAVDTDGDGVKEKVTLSAATRIGSSNRYNPPAIGSSEANSSIPGSNTGVARSVLSRTQESDRGIDTTGSEYTEGIA